MRTLACACGEFTETGREDGICPSCHSPYYVVVPTAAEDVKAPCEWCDDRGEHEHGICYCPAGAALHDSIQRSLNRPAREGVPVIHAGRAYDTNSFAYWQACENPGGWT